MVEKSCEPCRVQPVSPLSKLGLEIRFGPVPLWTSTSSTRHSPMPSRKICKLSLMGVPSASPRAPANSNGVHLPLVVSSLSAQLADNRVSEFGSFNSRLLPPPSDQ